MLKKIWQWLVQSSANARQVSLSAKAALLAIVPYILSLSTGACGLGLVCLGVEAEGLNQVVEAITNIIFWGLSIVSAIGFIYGFGRKVWLSITGNNEVVARWADRY